MQLIRAVATTYLAVVLVAPKIRAQVLPHPVRDLLTAGPTRALPLHETSRRDLAHRRAAEYLLAGLRMRVRAVRAAGQLVGPTVTMLTRWSAREREPIARSIATRGIPRSPRRRSSSQATPSRIWPHGPPGRSTGARSSTAALGGPATQRRSLWLSNDWPMCRIG